MGDYGEKLAFISQNIPESCNHWAHIPPLQLCAEAEWSDLRAETGVTGPSTLLSDIWPASPIHFNCRAPVGVQVWAPSA